MKIAFPGLYISKFSGGWGGGGACPQSPLEARAFGARILYHPLINIPVNTNTLQKTSATHLLNNHICQHRGMKTSTVTPYFCYVFNISLYCNDTLPSFIGYLWRVLLLGNHLKDAKKILLRHMQAYFINVPLV